ncbi:hypothetical protein XM38_012870 [Halomicronema hongdechloris C2206]|uniref:Piwi domain-containing protein n=1 Tax=Halomicronema hongdechloris C2206 TaxID=1641165 RepID=A0A1Z3HJ59_9CYAN|nr:hypothetical protein [Halomicronema hongdechloris]ASC70349.1 hypothetical protein XM38_012870 [Halomicronema hongdechloris C2206]
MNITIELISEPHLEFNNSFLHPDKKTGIVEHGPFGRTDPALHPDKIKVGIVGTRATCEACQQWISVCETYIETDRTKTENWEVDDDSEESIEQEELAKRDILVKGLSPDFIGINSTTNFASEIVTSDRWVSTFQEREAKAIADTESHIERVEKAADLISDHISQIATASPHPSVILVAIPKVLFDKASSAKLPNGNYLNLRRILKARSMKWGVPIQIFLEPTLTGKDKSLQDKATRAWNFATALYFKCGGVPWKGHGLEEDTCYIGISFYNTEDERGRNILRSGVAQAFDYLGQGIILRGDPFEWDSSEYGRTPHLKREEACNLITNTLNEYKRIRRLPPRRVVIHKSSRYWGKEHTAYNELDGFMEGIETVNPDASIDLLTLNKSDIRLAREGKYPPIRGTYALIEDSLPIIYTHGFTPYFETYPGVHVPEPWAIIERHGDSGPRELATELLALTKMNVNNAAFSDGVPITLAFSQRVGDVLKEVGPEMTVRSEYSFYM